MLHMGYRHRFQDKNQSYKRCIHLLLYNKNIPSSYQSKFCKSYHQYQDKAYSSKMCIHWRLNIIGTLSLFFSIFDIYCQYPCNIQFHKFSSLIHLSNLGILASNFCKFEYILNLWCWHPINNYWVRMMPSSLHIFEDFPEI